VSIKGLSKKAQANILHNAIPLTLGDEFLILKSEKTGSERIRDIVLLLLKNHNLVSSNVQ
jgi:hypothetical protein